MKREKILVTGGAGYIGSILVPFLVNKGFAVVVLDNFRYGQVSLLDTCFDKKLTVIRGDIRDHALVKNLIRDCDIILPLAALAGAPLCEKYPQEAKAVILDSIKFLTKLKSKRQLIIYPNTNSGYGIGRNNMYCTEDTPLHPISLYGKLKVKAEKIIMNQENCISLRLATVFGISPRMRLDLMVNDFVYRAVNDKFIVLFEANFKRNFIHVRDVARIFWHAISNFKKMRNQIYNVGLNEANLSKRELCEEIQKQVSSFTFFEANVGKDPDQRNYIVSNNKLEKTRFKPETSLTKGIKELIKGYQIIKKNQYSNI